MPRYFIEVSYKGTDYSGFQIQQNANSIQAEVEKALNTFFRFPVHPSPEGEGQGVRLTGSSRTDAGVHALQNFFHFDTENISEKSGSSEIFPNGGEHVPNLRDLDGAVYNLNALLPEDIVIKKIFPVKDNMHCRFDAVSREYKYFIYQRKDPFLRDTAFYFPYKLDLQKLNEAAQQVMRHEDFTSFSKKNTQVKTFECRIEKSEWNKENDMIVYNVVANRFLRGMVKGLVGTMLRVGTNKISVKDFSKIIDNKNCAGADFSPPSHGLFLSSVNYSSL